MEMDMVMDIDVNVDMDVDVGVNMGTSMDTHTDVQHGHKHVTGRLHLSYIATESDSVPALSITHLSWRRKSGHTSFDHPPLIAL